jgi:hypothetical protein
MRITLGEHWQPTSIGRYRSTSQERYGHNIGRTLADNIHQALLAHMLGMLCAEHWKNISRQHPSDIIGPHARNIVRRTLRLCMFCEHPARALQCCA